MASRERRSWTAHEDQLLRDAVAKEDPGNPNPSKWHAIAKHVPDRTNKDCRKRWFAKMASDVVKGGWAPDEDERLVNAIDVHGTRWSLVASMVQTRNSDQCAKRWTDTLNPAIDRTAWTAEADARLIRAVNEHGKVWTKIVKTYFPGRTGLAAKNRYNSITRSTENRYRNSSRKSESGTSSSSVSPITPTASELSFTRHPDYPQANLHLDGSRWSSPFSERSGTSSPGYTTHQSYPVNSYPQSYQQPPLQSYNENGAHGYTSNAYNTQYTPSLHSYPSHASETYSSRQYPPRPQLPSRVHSSSSTLSSVEHSPISDHHYSHADTRQHWGKTYTPAAPAFQV